MRDKRTRSGRAMWRVGVAVVAGGIVGLAPIGAMVAAPAPGRVEIKLREFVFEPKDITVRTTEVIFHLKNEGSIEHNFIIEDGAGKTVAQIPVIDAGKTDELKVALRPGAYAIVCNLPGHKDAGMRGALRVAP